MMTNGLPKGMASFLWATGVTVVAAVGLSRLLFLNWLAGGVSGCYQAMKVVLMLTSGQPKGMSTLTDYSEYG